MEEEDKIDQKLTYEITFIQRSEEEGNVLSVLKKAHAAVILENPMAKLRLAYPIKKERQGYFGVIRFQSYPEKIARVSQELGLEKDIIRFFITKVDMKNQEKVENILPEKGRHFRKRPKKVDKQETLSNEALEKKIEEILQ